MNAELVDALSEVIRMLEAAHRTIGMQPEDNKRIQKAKAVLEKARSA